MPRTASDPPVPRWVRWVCAVIGWVENHPIYLLPNSIRGRRYQFYDYYCYCSNCVDRRKEGLQSPGYLYKEKSNA